MRVFVSIEIPERIKEEIKKIQKKLPEFKGKITEEENLHLTLKFLGEIGEETLMDVKKRLMEVSFKSFETKISKIGAFSKDYLRIVWLSMDNCEKLQKIIDDKLLGIFPKEKRFMSHLTIARIKSVKNSKEFLDKLQKIEITPALTFKVENFKLKKSKLTVNGPIYENIEDYSLE